MKRVLAAFMFLASTQAQAMPVDKTTANAYYARCLADRSARLTDDDRQAICACSSAQVMKMMSAEDMRAVSHGDQAGRLAFKPHARQRLCALHGSAGSPYRHGRLPGRSARAGRDRRCDMRLRRKADRRLVCVIAGRQLMASALTYDPALTNPVGPVVALPEFTHERDKKHPSLPGGALRCGDWHASHSACWRRRRRRRRRRRG